MKSFKLYNMTCDGHSFISIRKPNAVPDSYYSLTEICYDQKTIKTIKGIYIGNDGNQKVEHIFKDIDINEILTGEESKYQKKILSWIKTLDNDDKNSIIGGTEIIDFCDEDRDQILFKIFMISLGSIFFYYHLMTLDQKKIGSPFDPINVTFPFTRVGTDALDQNIYRYIKYGGDILMTIHTKNIGKLWMKQIMDFWNIWGSLFPQKIVLNDTFAMYESVLNYSKYLQGQMSNMTKCYKTTEKVISNECKQLKNDTMEAIKKFRSSNDNFRKKYRYASLLITVISSIALKTMGAETKLSLKDYKDSSSVILKEQIDTLRGIVPEISEKVRADIRESVNKNISRKIKQSLTEVQNFQYQIDILKGEVEYLKGVINDNGEDEE